MVFKFFDGLLTSSKSPSHIGSLILLPLPELPRPSILSLSEFTLHGMVLLSEVVVPVGLVVLNLDIVVKDMSPAFSVFIDVVVQIVLRGRNQFILNRLLWSSGPLPNESGKDVLITLDF